MGQANNTAGSISRPKRREWIETNKRLKPSALIAGISRPKRREWIETLNINFRGGYIPVSPGLNAGSGLKQVCQGIPSSGPTRISRPKRREWIETPVRSLYSSFIQCISRPKRREWIETA